ncbi:MAG: type 2 isopentenyl-diphosphate Delta-isomerase [Nitrososphaerota archaeon]|jgi:isopentenyl-diphosphate delta-isomerase|nr:type 2 isopentenyl-diphosphate Delta-isomerase [Nitrososphaerota archaeon]
MAAEKTEKRKAEHIQICLEQKAQTKTATAGFEDIKFVHRALPEINREDINLSTSFLNKTFSAPLIVGAMTGGTEAAIEINQNIAVAVEKLGLGMGLGSQRAAVENYALEKTYAIARKAAPNAFLIANIGGIQLVHGYGVNEVRKVIEMIDADAVAIHLNALQEAVQPEGQTNFKGVLTKICEVASKIDKPVIVKETGAGISAEDAEALKNAGVDAIDVGGVGGTSFAAVEYYRGEKMLGEAFWDWGIPTVASIVEVVQSTKLPVIASGGVRTGINIAKALTLGASLAGIIQPVLETAVKSSKETEQLLIGLINELKNVLFLVGAKNIASLTDVPLVICHETAEWLKMRGFNIEEYAIRGAFNT